MSVKQRLAGWQLPALSPQTRSPGEANRVVLKRLGPRILRGLGCRQISRLLLVDELAAQAERIDDVIVTPLGNASSSALRSLKPWRARWNAQARAAPSFFGSKTRAQPCCIAPETVRDRSKPPAFAYAQQGTRRGDVKNRMGRFDNIISVSLRSRASPAAADRV